MFLLGPIKLLIGKSIISFREKLDEISRIQTSVGFTFYINRNFLTSGIDLDVSWINCRIRKTCAGEICSCNPVNAGIDNGKLVICLGKVNPFVPVWLRKQDRIRNQNE